MSIVTMLDSGSIVQLDSTRFTASSHALGDRVADMVARRREVGDAVDSLLARWRGDAACRFLSEWEVWRDGADGVIDDLRRDVAALHVAHADLGHGDTRCAQSSTRLEGRLG